MARDFNGATDRIDWANVDNLAGDALTISAWIWLDANADNDYIVCMHNSDETYGIIFNTTATNNVIAFIRRGTSDYIWATTGGVIGTGAWHHVLVTSDGGLLTGSTTIYYDGSSQSISFTNGSGAETAHTGSWSLGGRISSDTRNFDGKIAYAGVWSSALDAGTIAGLVSGKSPDFYPTNLLFWSLDGNNISNNIGGAAGTADGTTTYADPVIIRPATSSQQNQAQVSDAAVPEFFPAGGTTNITAAEDNQAQVSDAAVLGVFTPVAPSQQNQAQVSDAASLTASGPTYNVTVAQNNQAQVSDAAVLGVYTPIAPSQQAQAQVSDIAVISAGETNIAGAQNNQAQVSDAANLTTSNPFIVDDIILEWVADLANISPAQNNQAQVGDIASLGVYTPVAPSQQNQAQVSDAVTFSSIVYPLSAAQNNQAQVSDTAVLLFGEISVSAADNRQAQVSDAAILSAEAPTWNITAAENNQAQIIDPVSLTAIYILAAVENHQAQVSDLATLTVGGVFEHGERQLYEFDQRSNLAFAQRANLEVND